MICFMNECGSLETCDLCSSEYQSQGAGDSSAEENSALVFYWILPTSDITINKDWYDKRA